MLKSAHLIAVTGNDNKRQTLVGTVGIKTISRFHPWRILESWKFAEIFLLDLHFLKNYFTRTFTLDKACIPFNNRQKARHDYYQTVLLIL